MFRLEKRKKKFEFSIESSMKSAFDTKYDRTHVVRDLKYVFINEYKA